MTDREREMREMRLQFPSGFAINQTFNSNRVIGVLVEEKPKEKEEQTMDKLFTIIAIRLPSMLEQQQGIGTTILAGPTSFPSMDAWSAAAQFGAANADKITKAPAGLIKVTVKEGL